jgi:hypothetical protein
VEVGNIKGTLSLFFYRNKKGVSIMVTEEKTGLKYGYGNKLGVSNMVTETNWGLKNGYGRTFDFNRKSAVPTL